MFIANHQMETETLNRHLHSSHPLPLPYRILHRLFALLYLTAISAVLFRHAAALLHSFIHLPFLLSDAILAFMWLNSQAFRFNPVSSTPLPENLPDGRPPLDIFICTADPYKEPPASVAATVLSVMAYDYPPEKLSVYVSDDGGSDLTLFALLEAARFGKEWLPFCRRNRVVSRSPEAYFGSDPEPKHEARMIKEMYEAMKRRVENVVRTGCVPDEHKTSDHAFTKWTKAFTSQSHPAIIQVLSESSEDKDVVGSPLPNLVYVSRQKSLTSPHHFKAGALNALLRVSAVMTNAPIILTLDCDMISNDPSTPHKMLCYFLDPSLRSTLAYVQFLVRFIGLNQGDIYGSEIKRPYHIHPLGMNGLLGPDYFGTGTFFNRRVFYGNRFEPVIPGIPELGWDHVPKKPIVDETVLGLAHHVAGCDYEDLTIWGIKVGFRYGSLVEDYYTGYRLHCEGWKSIFCNPNRAAFLSEMPISLLDVVTQTKRWSVGLLEVLLSKHSPITYGMRYLGPLMAHCYSYYAFGPLWSIPITVYAFLPQIAMLNGIVIFPKVFDPWFLLYAFLFVGAYALDLFEFMLRQGTMKRWWSDQRMWLIRGLSSDLFGTLEYVSNRLGIAARGFDVTSKVDDRERRERYDRGMFEFGASSPMFVPLSTAAMVNLVAFSWGILKKERWVNAEMWIACFGVVNSWPVYEAMLLRSDEGRIPTKITIISCCLAWSLYALFSFIF